MWFLLLFRLFSRFLSYLVHCLVFCHSFIFLCSFSYFFFFYIFSQPRFFHLLIYLVFPFFFFSSIWFIVHRLVSSLQLSFLSFFPFFRSFFPFCHHISLTSNFFPFPRHISSVSSPSSLSFFFFSFYCLPLWYFLHLIFFRFFVFFIFHLFPFWYFSPILSVFIFISCFLIWFLHFLFFLSFTLYFFIVFCHIYAFLYYIFLHIVCFHSFFHFFSFFSLFSFHIFFYPPFILLYIILLFPYPVHNISSFLSSLPSFVSSFRPSLSFLSFSLRSILSLIVFVVISCISPCFFLFSSIFFYFLSFCVIPQGDVLLFSLIVILSFFPLPLSWFPAYHLFVVYFLSHLLFPLSLSPASYFEVMFFRPPLIVILNFFPSLCGIEAHSASCSRPAADISQHSISFPRVRGAKREECPLKLPGCSCSVSALWMGRWINSFPLTDAALISGKGQQEQQQQHVPS